MQNAHRNPPYKTVGFVVVLIGSLLLCLLWLQFHGELTPRTQLTVMSSRSGLSMDPGSKVTYNGVEIGRVAATEVVDGGGAPKTRITLGVDPKYINSIPANVDAEIKASTVFGNKYIAFSAPRDPVAQRITSSDVIDASAVTTEFNTLFESVVSVAQKVDPVKLNQTLTAAAQALDGLGERFGDSIANGNSILGDLDPQMPQIRSDIQRLAALGDVYADAAPDLFDALESATTTARTLDEQQANVDSALMASIGFGNTGGDSFERSGPYLVRGAHDLVTSSALFDEYSPALFCTIRNYHDVEPKIAKAFGGNGYSGVTHSEILGVGNPYVYPDNLPRTNAHGGPEGRPGCWQPVTRDLWPAPYLVMDTGISIAPYNHIELGQPILTEYVWGRQLGENTINP